MNKSLRLLLALSVSLSACVSTEEGDPTLDCESPQMFFPDSDGDGFGDDAKPTPSCEEAPPAGFVSGGGDCRDDVAAVHVGGKEICDTIDNDCDGKVDDADSSLDMNSTERFYNDNDDDGFGDPDEGVSVRGCAAPLGYVGNWDDCDDSHATVNPSAKEICDHLDNDCDGKWDMTDPTLDMTTAHAFYKDLDHDQHGAGAAMMACDQPSGYVQTVDDCNDNDNLALPGGIEICDGVDNDCDGGIDGTAALPN